MRIKHIVFAVTLILGPLTALAQTPIVIKFSHVVGYIGYIGYAVVVNKKFWDRPSAGARVAASIREYLTGAGRQSVWHGE